MLIRRQLQCSIFNTTFNPERKRLGNKVLRQRLKGHILAQYYPPKYDVIQKLRQHYPENTVEDEKEELRLEAVEAKKARGKGAPKKRTKEGECYCLTDLGVTIGHITNARIQSRRSSQRGDREVDNASDRPRFLHLVQHMHPIRRFTRLGAMYHQFMQSLCSTECEGTPYPEFESPSYFTHISIKWCQRIFCGGHC
jgi:hypothetical protein